MLITLSFFFISTGLFFILCFFSLDRISGPIFKLASDYKTMQSLRFLLPAFFTKLKGSFNTSSIINGFFISFMIYGFAILVYSFFTGTNLGYCTVYVNNIFYFLIPFFQSLYYNDNFFFLSVFSTVFFCNITVFSSVGRYFFKHFPGLIVYALGLSTGLVGLVVASSLYDIIAILVQCASITFQSRSLSFSLLELLQFFNLIAFNESQSFVPTQLLYHFVFILVLASLLLLQYTSFIDENYKDLDVLTLTGFTKGIWWLISGA